MRGSAIGQFKLQVGLLGSSLSYACRRMTGMHDPIQAKGRMFWFMRKKFSGSYFALSFCSRR